MRKVLVTGGAGFIGSHTCVELIQRGYSVVIVDDLDRAKVEQQRAFLRAILRFSRQMKFAVVVCMDEAAILASKPDPEAPEELLRKTIQLELHLPDRNREDLIFLVANLCNAAAARNPGWRTLLRHPQWIGDLVRCLPYRRHSGQSRRVGFIRRG